MLTTITAYWNRPDALKRWVDAIRASSFSKVHHIIYFVGERPPLQWWDVQTSGMRITTIIEPSFQGFSIGHYHNLGIKAAKTPWVMKLDIDSLPHVGYFRQLSLLLNTAGPREWFNGGMFYMRPSPMLCTQSRGITMDYYCSIMGNRTAWAGTSYPYPAGSNFVCRREDYLRLGGCDERFRGYGWEDYQQLYMLEYQQLGRDPLPGVVSETNVTQRCRDEISRRKAMELWNRNPWLCLLHFSHPPSADTAYRANIGNNRKVLLEYVTCMKHNGCPPFALQSSS